MNVLVTGGAGFVGSHLVDKLITEGHQVAVLDDLSTGHLENVPSGVRFFRGDVRGDLDDVFRMVAPTVVVHLAAQVSVPSSVEKPLFDESVNIGGTINILEASTKFHAHKVIVMSSAAVYGMPLSLPLVEDSPTNAQSPYGLSKLTAERYVRMIAGARGLRYTILRPANIYGPRQTIAGEGAVIPAFIDGFLKVRGPVVHGDGTQTRDFIFVSDMVDAIVAALHKGDGQTLNISNGEPVPVMVLWTQLACLLDWKRPPNFAPPRAGDISASVLCSKEARIHLGWQPKVPLSVGLLRTVNWAVAQQVAAACTEVPASQGADN